MQNNYVAMVIQINDVSNATAYEKVWKIAENVLTTELKSINSFEPAARPWDIELNRPYGIVFGAKDRDKFLEIYKKAKMMQYNAAIRHCDMIKRSLETAEVIGSSNNGTQIFKILMAKKPDDLINIFWLELLCNGIFLPDAGIYYCNNCGLQYDDETDRKIIRNIDNYAICVVEILWP